jgi:D-lactate dehydrogenase
MKIGFFGVKPWEKEYLEKKLEAVTELQAVFSENIISSEHLPEETNLEIICVFVDCPISRKLLEQMPQLKFVATRSTGFDHIDLVACKECGITVSSVPSYGENTVAEFAFGLILSLSRKIAASWDQVRETGSFNLENLQGFDLKGKTLGVIGTGKIGCHLIKMANGFDMNVIAYDPHPREELAKTLNFSYLSLEDVFKTSDIITLHVPYMPETHHLLNDKNIGLMKRGAYVVNTSRGGVIDTEALVRNLKSGQLGGAGLDVLEEEGVIKDELDFLSNGRPEDHNLKTIIANHVLIDFPNVIITPHNAFNSREALQRILDTTVENIKGFLENKPVNLVK